MSETKELTYSDVSEHSSKKVSIPIPGRFVKLNWSWSACSNLQDLYLVVHDKVYNATEFVDEHPYVLPSCSIPVPISSWRSITELVSTLTTSSFFSIGIRAMAKMHVLMSTLEVEKRFFWTLAVKMQRKLSKTSDTATRLGRYWTSY